MTRNPRWRLRPHDPARILALSRGSGLSPLVAQLLINRGIDDPRRATSFLEARMGSLHDPELLPGADVVVHPRRPGGAYPSGDLCGAGVAFKVAWQVCKGFGDGKRASPHLRDFLVRAMGLVALATVADVVPLSDENRILVRHGLAGIAGEPTI